MCRSRRPRAALHFEEGQVPLNLGWPTLGWAIDPIDPQHFIESYFERQPLVVNREQPDYFRHLLDLEQLDACLSASSLSHPQVGVVSAGRNVDSAAFAFPSGLIDIVRLYQQFDEGGTVIVSQIDLHHQPLAMLCRRLESELSTRFQANTYLTPAGATGFRSHYDSHDVFLLQVSGTKDWRLFDTPLELPHRGQHFNPKEVEDTPCTMRFELKPGDMCYLPRGVMHEAVARDEVSLHITMGVLHTSWTELLIEAVARASLTDPSLRRGLPVGFANPGFDRETARKTFHGLLAGLEEQADFDEVLDHFIDDLLSTRHPVVQGQLSNVRRAGTITAQTPLGAQPHLLYRIETKPSAVVLSCYGNELVLPDHVEPALRFALSSQRFCADDLPGDLDAPGKVVLVQRLVREGLVRLR